MKTILSGMQPSGQLHIGNYLGALKNWAALQNSGKYMCWFMIADLHAMTVNYDARAIGERTKNLALDYLACGIDPDHSTIFIQSHILEHTYLSWIFANLVPIAELKRMHQFKEKTASGEEAAMNTGLFTYPILMAADILIYKGDTVPVGEDQKQHVEITCDIARKFNNAFGKTFPEPELLLTPTPRVMSLTEPMNKMSKSKGEKNYIALSDSPETIKKKLLSAVTDTSPGETMGAGVTNLFTLLKAFAKDDATHRELLNTYNAKTLQYQELKETLAREIIATLAPIQEKRREFESRPEIVAEVLFEGTKKARALAQATLAEVKEKVGLK
ncbi:MAG: tryptophan--tRNA ligase [Candidatus Jacksonbacteria bacterium RIFOXYA2_FULL_44_7]|uniref:Tryptophan--tRNA ligase n=1 Tax=Candidatus Jacksonbacteria bacterium RIFCSPLOWO2_02_FULL_44_20 TaxID=1798460 RepID=A0A1G2AAX4_9BACT|nr:MAG: tryptophan--tRNA ligase [Candidatus Jacksonbacteria bacterium RIFCSPHIGHO2_02_FULL_44_25]OGY72150.1 MAG: tryptophan--tRNA ligase [Candidatus Jacksonbacteria bacterium RIFCSPHIGHO2_12_FULL_44_12]OGY73190.1 MAG: tryptophan--tRNA ligase [Candidatus Jacksonbacteria bacterium RIFCSPLOWO2_02_FULL_44_20]OGY74368.1 MAG: tryptophan--tRNA ligase [Candidatus Jacksonbacteria bacterium RIFCSPLOWO2_12_FULL_44_15b]OGY75145.1 MAG: tryptophan--tRNA ligase [Candidatus Jacksonbacteria bacterium RIFOXYA2_F